MPFGINWPKSKNKAYRPEHFSEKELLHPDLYDSLPKSMLLAYFDPYILISADLLRKRYGPAMCNTWGYGGTVMYRGLRPFNSHIGAEFSLHKFGKALDLVFYNTTAEEIREDMQLHPNRPEFRYISRVEDSVDWLHIDRANIAYNGIYFFKP